MWELSTIAFTRLGYNSTEETNRTARGHRYRPGVGLVPGFLERKKTLGDEHDRRGETIFIDARQMGESAPLWECYAKTRPYEDEPFEEKIERLKNPLLGQFSKSEHLERETKQNLKAIGNEH